MLTRGRVLTLPAICLALVLAALPAASLAAHPHFVVGPNWSVNPQTKAVTASGKIAGLGNADVTAVLRVVFATQCRNPGGNVAPGQDASASTTQTGLRPENGNLVFSITTPAPLVTNATAG